MGNDDTASLKTMDKFAAKNRGYCYKRLQRVLCRTIRCFDNNRQNTYQGVSDALTRAEDMRTSSWQGILWTAGHTQNSVDDTPVSSY
jgi:hypothetical protein